MKYGLLVYETPEDLKAQRDPVLAEGYWKAYTAYSQALEEAGVAAGGAGLQQPTLATTVRIRGDKRHVQDGPFADTKEQLGGMFIIDVPNLDEALKWAALCPAAKTGCIEVRPILDMP
jgi:hypothetical protein